MITVNSKQVAEAMGKRHDNLKRAIRTDAAKLENPERYYIESSYIDPKKQERKCFEITMEGCERLAEKLPLEDREAFLLRCKGEEPVGATAYTVKEAAEIVGISERTMRRKVTAGEIPSFKQTFEQVIKSERTMIPAGALSTYMEGR